MKQIFILIGLLLILGSSLSAQIITNKKVSTMERPVSISTVEKKGPVITKPTTQTTKKFDRSKLVSRPAKITINAAKK